MIKRRQLLKQAVMGFGGLPMAVTAAIPFTRAGAAEPGGTEDNMQMSQIERNKRLVREQYDNAQSKVIPPTLPGAADLPAVAPPMEKPSAVISYQDPPGGV